MNDTEPSEELRFLYEHYIEQAKQVFGKNFTCKLKIAPHGDQFEVAVIPLEHKNKKYDNVQVSLTQLPAVFMDATLRMGGRSVISIGTGSGGVSDLWHMVKPIVNLLEKGVTVEELLGDPKFSNIAKLKAEGQIGFYEYDGEGNPVKKDKK